MIFALKITLSLKNIKILRFKVTKILQICLEMLCESCPKTTFNLILINISGGNKNGPISTLGQKVFQKVSEIILRLTSH